MQGGFDIWFPDFPDDFAELFKRAYVFARNAEDLDFFIDKDESPVHRLSRYVVNPKHPGPVKPIKAIIVAMPGLKPEKITAEKVEPLGLKIRVQFQQTTDILEKNHLVELVKQINGPTLKIKKDNTMEFFIPADWSAEDLNAKYSDGLLVIEKKSSSKNQIEINIE